MRAERAFPTGSEPVASVPESGRDMLDQVLSIRDATEEVFLTTGSQLIELSSLLDTARQGARSLDLIVRGGLLDRLRGETASQSAAFESLTGGFQTVDAGVVALTTSLNQLGADLQDVRRSVVTMRMVVLNARVTLASLHEQDQHLTNFAEDGQTVVAAIVDLLSRFEEAMPTIRELVQETALAVKDVSTNLDADVLVAFRRLMEDVSSFEAGARTASGKGYELSGRLQGLLGATAAAVSGLQVGDSTRQQLDHVAFILSLPEAPDPALRALAEALVVDAAALHCRKLDELRRSVGQMVSGLNDLIEVHLSGFLEACGKAAAPEVLQQDTNRLDLAIKSLQPVQSKAAALEQAMMREFDAFRDLIREGEQVQQSTRQIGINAVLSCTRIGSGGQGLKVVAEQLQFVAHEVGSRFSAMRKTLDGVGAQCAQTNSAIDHALRSSIEMPERLANSMGPLIENVTESLLPVNTAVLRLRDRLADLNLDFGPAMRHAGQLRTLAEGFGSPDALPPSDHLSDDVLSRVAAVFTIERERDVFRAILPSRAAILARPSTEQPVCDPDDGFFL